MSMPSAVSNPLSPNGLQYRARSYQLEMLEESLKANIIVAMDTGSGKTHIAVLRIMAELDRCPPQQLVWFLAPTVALCTQQHEVILLQLPAVRARLLIGSDNVDRWSNQQIWDAALKDVQVVVSTHAVLADALGHGFVNMSRLALLIFDEAHHCARGHPANKIMQDFYHCSKHKQGPIPDILGLTASPIMRSKPSELMIIEANLDATSITPRVHRQELLKFVHRPTMIRLDYIQYDPILHVCRSRVLRKLYSVCPPPNVTTDLLNQQPEAAPKRKQGQKFLTLEESCMDQLKRFCSKAQHIYEELGTWAADYFIIESIKNFKKSVNIEKGIFAGWEGKEKTYILRALATVDISGQPVGNTPEVSPKFDHLISFLSENYHPDFSGLVFVQQRATVSVMFALLSIHPKTRNRFRCAPFVGLSNSANRKQNLGELLDHRAMCDTLDDFRNQRKNLIIATDVLEEGIDITACHMVICFNRIPNLKSFIQRRGRARQERSTYAIMLASNEKASRLDNFQDLEEEMLRTYQDEARLQERASALESIGEDVTYQFRVERTEALLKAESAMGHLHHFCDTLPRLSYVDLRPNFTFVQDKQRNLIKPTVVLPNCLCSSVRRTSGIDWWQTERAAMKDAAFQAYVGLYKVGLLTDNLLPFPREQEVEGDAIEKLSSIVNAHAQLNPWVEMAEAWNQPKLHQTQVSIKQESKGGGESELRMVLRTPSALPAVLPFALYWDSETILIANIGPSWQASAIGQEGIENMRNITHGLLRAVHSDYMSDERKDFVALFTPDISPAEFGNWLKLNRGRRLALQEFRLRRASHSFGLVRSSLLHGIPHVFQRWRTTSDDDVDRTENLEQIEVQVECVPLMRRRNFLHRATLSAKKVDTVEGEISNDPHGALSFPANSCTFDLLPYEQAKFGLFIPSILQHVEVVMIATKLKQTILKDVPFKDIQHVVEAITASSAQRLTNYQRYEFIGDSILKFVVSSQLYVDHINWHEGYLSERRARLVSNTCLANAALDAGLDAYILTKPFTAKQWTPPLISNAKDDATRRRDVSSKTLADVVEALIGAAFLDGGLSVATTCIDTFLADIHIRSPQHLFAGYTRRTNQTNSAASVKAQQVIGYQFVDYNLLAEALNHPSCERDAVTESYQRLEFLGDAVLDMIIVSVLSQHQPHRSHGDMTMIKAALVNADLLAYFCLDFSITYDTVDIEQKSRDEFREVHSSDRMQLWRLMRHHSQEIMAAQQACLGRYQDLGQEIEHFMKRGASYPWALLARLNADKFFSDIIESLLGAIFVDSGGCLVACRNFAERIGIVPYLHRILAEGIEVTHPRTALGHLTGPERIDYVVSCEEGSKNLYRCLVKINDAHIITVGECLTKDEAMVRAADAAVKLLKETKGRGA